MGERTEREGEERNGGETVWIEVCVSMDGNARERERKGGRESKTHVSEVTRCSICCASSTGWKNPVADMTDTFPRRHCSLGTPHWSSSSSSSAPAPPPSLPRQPSLSRVDSPPPPPPPPSEANPAHSRYSCQNWAGSSSSASSEAEEARRNEPELSRRRFFSFLFLFSSSLGWSAEDEVEGASGKADPRGTAMSVRVCRSIAVGMVEHMNLDESLKWTGCGSPTVDRLGKRVVNLRFVWAREREREPPPFESTKLHSKSNRFGSRRAGCPASSSRRSVRAGQAARACLVLSKPALPARKWGAFKSISMTACALTCLGVAFDQCVVSRGGRERERER